MDRLSRSLSDRMLRRNSFTGVSVDLDFQELQHFLWYLSSSYAHDPEIVAAAEEHVTGLAARLRAGSLQGHSIEDELNEIVEMLGAILNDINAPNELPSKIVAQIHSFVGLLRARQKRYDCAIQSYLKALWVQTSSVDARDSLNIAITENRLGLAYGKCGDLPQAISLLEKTLEHYDKAKMKTDHYCVVEAQTALLDFRSRHLQQSLSLSKHNPLGRPLHGSMRSLDHIIHEEREYQVEHDVRQTRRARAG